MTITPNSELWDRLPTPHLAHGEQTCGHPPRSQTDEAFQLIVLTGGPGAGKTAVLQAARSIYCEHVSVLPEAATVLFGGGFPRYPSVTGRAAAQRAIYCVQREAEQLVEDEQYAHAALCDRGTIDGEAYWPGPAAQYWEQVGSSRELELARYALVVHLRTPEVDQDYTRRTNAVRLEDATVARAIDERIFHAWRGHPNRVIVEPTDDFQHKLDAALGAIAPLIEDHRRTDA